MRRLTHSTYANQPSDASTTLIHSLWITFPRRSWTRFRIGFRIRLQIPYDAAAGTAAATATPFGRASPPARPPCPPTATARRARHTAPRRRRR